MLSQSFLHPTGRPTDRGSPVALGLEASVHGADEEIPVLRIAARRFVYGVRVDVPGFRPGDDAFSIEPGHARDIALRRERPADPDGDVRGVLTAINLQGSYRVASKIGA